MTARPRLKPEERQQILREIEQRILYGVPMPKLYHRIVDHLKKLGFPPSSAWPIAVESVAIGCLKGETNLPRPGKKGEKQKLGKAARARYCSAYKEWKTNHPKGSGIGKRRGKG